MLAGQVAVVTGAGRGIGRSYARAFAAHGATVVVNDIGVDGDGDGTRFRADAVCEEIRAAGGSAVASHDDIATADGGRALIDLAAEHSGRVDIVVHNAGLTTRAAGERAGRAPGGPVPFVDADVDLLHAYFESHLVGAFYVGQPAWRLMADHGYGRIVLTSSASAFGFDTEGYSISKIGVLALVRGMAMDAAKVDADIMVNAVAPMAATAPVHAAENEKFHGLMDPDNVAEVVLHLVSPACSVSGAWFRAGATYVSEIVLGLTAGWAPESRVITAADVAANLDAARAQPITIAPDYPAVNDAMLRRLFGDDRR